MAKEKVLIVGGGFAGTKAALELSRDEHFEVTLLSDSEHFTYFPTLYHVATGGARANASIPLKTIFKDSPIELRNGRAVSIDRHNKSLTTQTGQTYYYDTLLLGLGEVTNYFNIPGLAELSFGVKSIEEVERLKAHLHSQLLSDHKPDLNYVIVGGGPTGVELAGSLEAYLLRTAHLHGIENRPIHIDIVEASKRLLQRLPKDMSRVITRQLRRQGIHLYLNKKVEGETANQLMVSGKPIQSHTVIWTAGTANNPFYSLNDFTLSYNHKVATDIYLQAEPNIFVLGDNANTPYSGMAQTAIYDAIFVANNLKRRSKGKSFKSYVAHPPITVIPVREGWAGISWGHVRLYGWIGWLLRQAADAKAFHYFEPWSKAMPQWFSYSAGEAEQCTICNKQLS